MSCHSFEDIGFFLRIVELGSIRAVAREFSLQPSNISRKITRLEQRLGSKLIERTQSRSIPTDAGKRYYQHMRMLLPQIEEAEANISGESIVPKGILRVTASIDFGQTFVVPWLLEIRKRYPSIEVQLKLASHHVDLVNEGIDVAIRIGTLKDSSLMAKKLADVPRVLVASPGYLKNYGTPETPNDLTQHQFVFYTPIARPQLKLIDNNDQNHFVQTGGAVTINAINSMVQAVVEGHGMAAGPRWAFQTALNKREVVELLPTYRQDVFPMNAIWSPAVLLPARIRLFIDFIAEQVKQVEGLISI